MRLSTSIIVMGAVLAAGLAGSLVFSYLADKTRGDTVSANARLALLQQRIADKDSLDRLDSVALNVVTPDLAFHDLRGRVRSMSCGEENVEFDREGNWKNPQAYVSRMGNSLNFERNKFDYIIVGVTCDEAEGVPVERVEYEWSDNRVKRMSGTGLSGEYTAKYTYDGRHLLTQSFIVSSDESGKSEIVTTYTYQEFDSYGNWTRRTARSAIKTTQYGGYYDDENDTFIDGSEPVLDSTEEVQQRRISYYN